MKLNIKKHFKVNPIVFFVSAGLTIIFVAFGVGFSDPQNPGKDAFSQTLKTIQNYLTTEVGWFYLFTAVFFLVFIIWIALSKHGKIRLGRDDEEPEFSFLTWVAMLFSAGMGIGLLFYGVAEPIGIFANPPASDITPESVEAAKEAMRYTYFHWGLHSWAIYIIIGLALAYFSYRHNLPLSPRSALYPILGKKIHGFWGDLVEIFAVLGTLFGVATSLGFGAMQVNSGLDHLGIISNSTANQIYLIIGITLIATISVVSGVNKGIRRLSEGNLIFALLLLIFVFIAGPTQFLLKSFSANLGNYIQTIVKTSFETDRFESNQFSTTVFYLAWWIAWSPFVGLFIARISRGRTIREFICCILIVPVILTFAWMTVFGNTAIHMELAGTGGMVEAVNENVATSLFVMLENLPMQQIACGLAVIVVTLFFVTSSDSASLVIDIITSGGKKNPPVWQKIFWAATEGIVAIILLLGGGLTALQTMVIIMALPFGIVLLFVCYSLWKGLRVDTSLHEANSSLETHQAVISRNAISMPAIQPIETSISPDTDLPTEEFITHPAMVEQLSAVKKDEGFYDNWTSRLRRLKKEHYKDYFSERLDIDSDKKLKKIDKKMSAFIKNIVAPAFEKIAIELAKYNRDVKVSISHYQASIIVKKGNYEEVYYGIRAKAYQKFGYTFPSFSPTETEMKFYAEILTRSGTKATHPIVEFTEDGIIHDFLNEYEKWAILD